MEEAEVTPGEILEAKKRRQSFFEKAASITKFSQILTECSQNSLNSQRIEEKLIVSAKTFT